MLVGVELADVEESIMIPHWGIELDTAAELFLVQAEDKTGIHPSVITKSKLLLLFLFCSLIFDLSPCQGR